MSEEKKYTKNEELCEEITELSMDNLNQVTGGSDRAAGYDYEIETSVR